MAKAFFVLLCVLGYSPVFAQDHPDYQFRALLHKQIGITESGGLAFWAVAPDVTKTNPRQFLLVGGPLFKGSGGWLELMGGSFVKTDGTVDAAFNMRASRIGTRFLFYTEAMYVFPKKRLIVPFSVTRRVKLGALNLGFGLESEVTLDVGATSWRFGPRIVVPILKKASLATVYQWHSRQSLLRQYLLLNF